MVRTLGSKIGHSANRFWRRSTDEVERHPAVDEAVSHQDAVNRPDGLVLVEEGFVPKPDRLAEPRLDEVVARSPVASAVGKCDRLRRRIYAPHGTSIDEFAIGPAYLPHVDGLG